SDRGGAGEVARGPGLLRREERGLAGRGRTIPNALPSGPVEPRGVRGSAARVETRRLVHRRAARATLTSHPARLDRPARMPALTDLPASCTFQGANAELLGRTRL